MSGDLSALAHAKLNLALVVGPLRADGKHEVRTVLQQLDLADTVTVRPARETTVAGFAGDSLVAAALEEVRRRTGMAFAATIEKRIPVAAGLAGGSTDAATALVLANRHLGDVLPLDELHAIAAVLGSDVPFFLASGPMLGTGDGSTLLPVALPHGYVVVLALPHGAAKESTAAIYRAFDERDGAQGYAERCERLAQALDSLAGLNGLAAFPANDLCSSPLSDALRALGAVRADVTGAGPVVYGLFADSDSADAAAVELKRHARTWIARPRW